MKIIHRKQLLILYLVIGFLCFITAVVNDMKLYITYIAARNYNDLQNELRQDHKEITHYRRNILFKTKYPTVVSQNYKINNKNICKLARKISCLVMVHSTPDHFERRMAMRATWLNATYYNPENVRVVFLLGLVSDNEIQFKIEKESERYNDIVQGYFIDSYHNLTNKGVMGFKWISEYCMNAEIVAKVDDDVVVNFFRFFEQLSYIKQKKKHILCRKMDRNNYPIMRDHKSKWFVEEYEYRHLKVYPHTYCSGLAVFLTTDLVPVLYQAAISTPFFWVDDFYLFGILPSKISGVVYETIRSNFTLIEQEGLECYQKYGRNCPFVVLTIENDERFNDIWSAVIKDRIQSVYGNYYMDP